MGAAVPGAHSPSLRPSREGAVLDGPAWRLILLSGGVRNLPGGFGVGIQTREESTEPREVTGTSVERILRITKPSFQPSLCVD